MAYSGSIGNTTFNALKVIDHAYRRCRLPAQAITSEMQNYALDSLFMLLSDLANVRTPSWCIEKLILPMYENQPIIPMPAGTIDILNLNYRQIQPVTGAYVATSTSYTVNFTTSTVVDTVGIKWSAASVPLTFQTSVDGTTWITVGSADDTSSAGEINWTDISGAIAYQYFRITSTATISYSAITLGNLPQEIPLGLLNRDGYVNQSNKYFPGRPSNYWYQRDLPNPVVNLWPAPFLAAENAQLILWRHRQIMDTQNLQQQVEIPTRWYDAIVNKLAYKVARETPAVDMNLFPLLQQDSNMSEERAWEGDGDRSPTYIQPSIGVYTA
jgi:hypothetical protein